MNAQKESLKKTFREFEKTSVHKLPVCDENESRRIRRKKRQAPKIFFDGRTPASHVNFGIYTYKKERNLSGVTQVNHKSKLPYITKGCLFNDTSFYHPSCERACACSLDHSVSF